MQAGLALHFNYSSGADEAGVKARRLHVKCLAKRVAFTESEDGGEQKK